MITARQMERDYLKEESQNQKVRFLQIRMQKLKSRTKVSLTPGVEVLEKLVEEDSINSS